MLKFEVSAPGKVILFGEHSVVYGKTAVAASVDLRTYLSFQILPASVDTVHFKIPATNLDRCYPITQLEKVLESYQPQNTPEESINQITKWITLLDCESDAQKMSLQAILFLLMAILQERKISELKPFTLEVKTELSIGSGLGSSASFAVCLATCFLHYTNLVLGKPTTMDKQFRDEISRFAFECEKLMHGTPSGIDNTICTFGSLLKFKKEEPIEILDCVGSMRIMLVDTKVPRSTKVLVAKTRELKTKYPKVFDPIFESMNEIAEIGLQTVIQMMKAWEDHADVSENYKTLKMFMEKNQCLLSAIGVSHLSLDTICVEAQNSGFGAKLTGAGGGGYAIIAIPPGANEDDVKTLANKLQTRHGFEVKITKIGGLGVQIY